MEFYEVRQLLSLLTPEPTHPPLRRKTEDGWQKEVPTPPRDLDHTGGTEKSFTCSSGWERGGGHQAQERGLTPCPPPPSVSTMILKQVPGAIVCVAALRMTECMELRMIFAFLGAPKSSGLEELGKNIYKL